MLVVVGIMIVLAGLLLPAINKAYRTAQRTAVANDLQAIGTALEAYRADFKDYPRSGLHRPHLPQPRGGADPPEPHDWGAQVLCFALIGAAQQTEPTYIPGYAAPAANTTHLRNDGAAGPGFRARARSEPRPRRHARHERRHRAGQGYTPVPCAGPLPLRQPQSRTAPAHGQ
jgi:type II secretory pathway pseudopilin PulG